MPPGRPMAIVCRVMPRSRARVAIFSGSSGWGPAGSLLPSVRRTSTFLLGVVFRRASSDQAIASPMFVPSSPGRARADRLRRSRPGSDGRASADRQVGVVGEDTQADQVIGPALHEPDERVLGRLQPGDSSRSHGRRGSRGCSCSSSGRARPRSPLPARRPGSRRRPSAAAPAPSPGHRSPARGGAPATDEEQPARSFRRRSSENPARLGQRIFGRARSSTNGSGISSKSKSQPGWANCMGPTRMTRSLLSSPGPDCSDLPPPKTGPPEMVESGETSRTVPDSGAATTNVPSFCSSVNKRPAQSAPP